MAYPNSYQYYYPEQSSNTGLIVGLTVGALVLTGVGVGTYLYLNQETPSVQTNTQLDLQKPTEDAGPNPWDAQGEQEDSTLQSPREPQDPQAPSDEQIGVLKHSSGKCIHPYGGQVNAGNGTKLVYYSGCDGDALKFKMLANGSIQHVGSGRCVHPQGWFNNKSQDQLRPDNGTPLVLWDGCGADKNKFKIMDDGSLQHVPSGKCVHPISGFPNPKDNDDLVIWDGCGEPKTRVSFVPV
uniref:Agglutinin n=1 Tax=Clandestinovirus TaxID=2831644 RepID=A0A8F8KQ20_9VIRU|nr:agglutinin [Clandestinovirus]